MDRVGIVVQMTVKDMISQVILFCRLAARSSLPSIANLHSAGIQGGEGKSQILLKTKNLAPVSGRGGTSHGSARNGKRYQ